MPTTHPAPPTPPTPHAGLPEDLAVRSAPAVEGEDYACLVAEASGRVLGTLTWARGTGTVEMVHVAEDVRRRGVATVLWRAAQQVASHLRHDGEEITVDGLAWARAVGGPWNTAPAAA